MEQQEQEQTLEGITGLSTVPFTDLHKYSGTEYAGTEEVRPNAVQLYVAGQAYLRTGPEDHPELVEQFLEECKAAGWDLGKEDYEVAGAGKAIIEPHVRMLAFDGASLAYRKRPDYMHMMALAQLHPEWKMFR